MPQIDRHKDRTVNIEFIPTEDLESLPYTDRLTLVFVTSGTFSGQLNGHPLLISAPGILCLSNTDKLTVTDKDQAFAQSFSYHPDFLNTIPVPETDEYFPRKIRAGLSLFQGNDMRSRVPRVTERAFHQLMEWFFVLGTEVSAQSDANWVCRIKKYLFQILGLLEDLNRYGEQTPVDSVLEYIHTRYPDKITLEDLTRCGHLNRVSLNKKFQERFGCTAIGYLLSYRLKVAEDLLTHTGMSLNEIAVSTGFDYDTYFIKQFSAKKGMSPTVYRNTSRKFATAQ
ncbi:helix-turn-helix transcriptional regulator [Paenibacillus sp. HN-1]|uniref:AraC family transcriptional regulator n=1 Tax=Paenibacillus TaxID=44249 RepID=UPI001CA917B2|nr:MULTISPECIES: AraC family transcriptional regulator [Paenibacillus]MBY9082223.1 helix-turn-helix transcriptional regulator [Paenibacillus sp. CGMCC 1.18879]MBY9087321.1 helix-turn-helix transcriptional regulator [Paenibacillus sinensis]